MARPKKIERTVYKNIALTETLAARVDLELFSEVENRIPYGAQQEFFCQLLANHFAAQSTLVEINLDGRVFQIDKDLVELLDLGELLV